MTMPRYTEYQMLEETPANTNVLNKVALPVFFVSVS